MPECPGVYKLAEMKDGLLARVRIPGGSLTAEQMRAIAELSNKYGNGYIDLTNRANLQIRGLAHSKQGTLIDNLRRLGLASSNPAHDRLRNIMIDPMSGLLSEHIDCRPIARAIDEQLAAAFKKDASPANPLNSLSPKFSIVLDGGGQTNISAIPHDLCMKATGDKLELLIYGQSTSIVCKPGDAPKAIVSMMQSLEAVALQNQLSAEDIRLAFLQQELGHENLTRHLLDTVPQLKIQDQTGNKAVNRKAGLNPSVSPLEIKDGSSFALTLAAPISRLRAHQLEGLAELVERFKSTSLRLTPWQAIIIPNINENDIAELWSCAESLGFLTQPSEQNLRILTCAGSKGCPRGQFETHQLALALRETLANEAVTKPTTVHLSACEKGCARRQPCDFLYMQRESENGPRLYRDAAPQSASSGSPADEKHLARELIKHLV